jgi:ABC-type glycerol-3-phosphate transport system substrate-binding protein
MKKKLLSMALIGAMCVGSIFANGGKEVATTAPAEITGQVGGTLKIWSFTNELRTFALAYQEAHPDVNVEYTMIPMTNGEYQTKVKAAISSGDVPDVIALEAAFVRDYVESDFLLPLNDLMPKAKELQTYQFMLDIGTYEGVTKAYSYQATPGALFYRRSLAKKYFGTDDPIKMQEILSSMDKFKEAAAKVKADSNGNTFMVGSSGDFMNLFYSNRSTPWVIDDKLNIDQKVYDMIETAKEFRQNGWEAQATQWGPGWFAGMNDSLKDASGTAKQIFCYFLPTWGLPYVLMPNSESKTVDGNAVGNSTSGDWACINGPMPYYWGGTWMGVMDEAKNAATAKDFIEFATLNKETLKNWALGTYTNAYLKKIDSSIGDTQGQGAGDFVSSQVVVKEITSKFDNSDASAFLAGQNSYSGFAKAAPTISLKLMQGTDDAIQRALNDPLDDYVSGKSTKDQLIKQFKDNIRTAVPDVIVK